MLAHRLGLVPLVCEGMERVVKAYNRDCTECDSHCSNCSVTLVLNARCDGPGTMDVTTKHLVVENGVPSGPGGEVVGRPFMGTRVDGSEDTEGILLVKLAVGQEVKMKCIATKVCFPLSLSLATSSRADFASSLCFTSIISPYYPFFTSSFPPPPLSLSSTTVGY